MKISKKDIMLKQNEILEYLKKNNTCKNEQIAEIFHLSMSTVRRYVQQMEDEGLIRRFYGGIILNRPEEPDIAYELYSKRNAPEKASIMEYVAHHLISDGDTIFINGSSTAMYLYQFLNVRATLVTNNSLALFTKHTPKNNFLLIGGEPSTHGGDNILCGEFALSMISAINASVAILGVSGISAVNGLTSSSPQDVSINKMMLSKTTGKKIIVADHSKIGRTFSFSFARLNEITHIVTDSKADPDELRKIRMQGINVITVTTNPQATD